MKSRLFISLVVLIIATCNVFQIGCNLFGSNQEIDAQIISFIANRQPPDISEVRFMIKLEGNENTVSGVVYIISLSVDGQVTDSQAIISDESGNVSGTIYLTAHGAGMNRMLSALDQKYEDAKSNYEDFEEEMAWEWATGRLYDKSYDEIERLQEQEEHLKADVNRWEALRQGRFLQGTALHDFCIKYVDITIERETS